MELSSVSQLLRTVGGGAAGFALLFAFALTVAASAMEFYWSYKLYQRYRALGSARGAIASMLEAEWTRLATPSAVMRLLAWLGVYLASLVFLFLAMSLAMHIYRVGLGPLIASNWRGPVGSLLADTQAALSVLAICLFVRLGLGGLTAIAIQKARSFAFIGRNIPAREEIDRIRKLGDSLDERDPR
jgi:hypothetical protein